MRIKTEKPAMADVDMTPMIDIVFQLIAFFMVITNFEQTQADERVKLPKDELARPPEVARENKRTFNIGFVRDKKGEIEAGPYCFFAEAERDGFKGGYVPVLQMGKFLAREARLLARDDKLKDTTVIIRADREVPTGLLQEFIKLAQEAKFEKFALSATQEIKQ